MINMPGTDGGSRPARTEPRRSPLPEHDVNRYRSQGKHFGRFNRARLSPIRDGDGPDRLAGRSQKDPTPAGAHPYHNPRGEVTRMRKSVEDGPLPDTDARAQDG